MILAGKWRKKQKMKNNNHPSGPITYTIKRPTKATKAGKEKSQTHILFTQ